MQRQHSDCCLPEKHEPCYPQTSDVPAKRENYAFASRLKSDLEVGDVYVGDVYQSPRSERGDLAARLGDVYQPRHLSTGRDWRRPINDVTGNCSIM